MANQWTGARPSPSTATRTKQGAPLWEDAPLSVRRMDFRADEAERAAERGEPTAPSRLNTTPGSCVRIHAGWTAAWVTDPKKLRLKADQMTASVPRTSYWRSLIDPREATNE